MDKKDLLKVFHKAELHGSRYVFVEISAEGVVEYICIPRESFEAKYQFYLKAYTDDLVHCMNANVRIRGISYGDSSELDNIQSL